ncbi:MAG: mechanosensitive ion channel [Myxococcales bacterium FL481]|nr:MAG: mechanosensitive ion channel [Myxococcales bacterium FL481]
MRDLVAMDTVQLPPALAPYLGFFQSLAAALAMLVGGWIVAKWLAKLALSMLRRRKLDEAVARFLASLIQWALLAAAVIAALNTAGIETTSFVAVLGSAGLALGLALQGNLGHFASGVMLLMFRPFTTGDVVTVAGSTGSVEEIGLFATTLVSPDNETIIVPNGAITSNKVINLTARGTRRGAVEIGLAYGTKIEDAIRVLTEAVEGADLVLKDPAPGVLFVGFGASSIDFKITAWTQAPDYLAMLHGLRERIYNALNEAGIDIPYQQIVVRNA